MSESVSKADEQVAAVPVAMSDDDNTGSGKEELGISEDFIDPVVERRILRKIDLNLVTLFGALSMMSQLDRSNIGNANLTGFSTDLGLVDNQYGAAVSVVYSTYVIFEPVWTVLLKIVTPKILLTCSCFAWATLTLGGGFLKTYPQLLGVRVLLGAVEAAIVPCIFMYCTMAYNRDEQGTRQTYVTIFSCMSGAFGGLLAFGLTQINTPSMHGWQWMYLVEGIISFCLVPIVFWRLPNTVSEARWLKPSERAVIAARLERNKGVYDKDEKFSTAELVRCISDWKVWVQAINHFGIDSINYSLSNFMPKIIAGLGFTSTVNSQLLTVPVYVVSGLSFLIVGYFSDRYKLRFPFIVGGLLSSLIGFVILAVDSTPVGARYFALFLVAIALYPMVMLNVVWASNNHAGYFKRALATGLVQLVGNSSGASIGFIFTTYDAPRYIPGMHFIIGMCVMSLCLTGILAFAWNLDNKKKRKLIAEGAADQPELGDRNPHYIYYL